MLSREVGQRSDASEPRLVVGVGGSAGGIAACQRLLVAMPHDSGLALVVVLRVGSSEASDLAQVLQIATKLRVLQAADQHLESDCVYVIAPDTTLEVRDGRLHTAPRGSVIGHEPVDELFISLAREYGHRAIAIVLSGTGESGSKGMLDVNARGGLCVVQDPETAEFDGMPRHALGTGAPDYVLALEEMPQLLLDYAADPETVLRKKAEPMPDRTGAFDHVLDLLNQQYGVSFQRSYKRGTIERRAGRRLGLKHVPDWPSYLKLLQEEPAELAALYRDLLIGVTEFFRDPEVWAQLESDIIPRIISEHRDELLPIKVWVPGCATGEEPYSLAIVFLEQMARLQRSNKLQIFASDLAEDALGAARRGRYPPTIAENVSAERLTRFFHRDGADYVVNREVRDVVTFASQNLLADPPFSGLALVSCRNVLIYLDSYAQQRVLQLFHFALRPGGLLVLGTSETVGYHADLFEAVSLETRVYRATPTTEGMLGLLPWQPNAMFRSPSVTSSPPPKGARVNRVIEQFVLSRYSIACVAVSESFQIQAFFGRIREYLTQPTGEARLNVLAWARPGLYAMLRPALEEARERKATVHVTGMRIDDGPVGRRVECSIEPIAPMLGEAPLYLVAFRDTPEQLPAVARNDARAERSLARELAAELEKSREALQSTIEQLDAANEEYRASHEELLSLNEELQANNEELESSKAELQSLNEAMAVINEQMGKTNVDLRSTNADLNNLLVSAAIPIIFLDRELCIRRFTPATTALMSIVSSDLGRSIEHLEERLHDRELTADATRVLENLLPVTVEVHTERGRDYERTVLPYRTEDDRIDGVCVAFHDITDRKKAAHEVGEARVYAETIVDTIRASLVVLDDQLRVLSANRSFYTTFGLAEPTVLGRLLYEIGNGDWNIPELRRLLEAVLPYNESVEGYELEHVFSDLGLRSMLVNARRMKRQGHASLILIGFEDVTDRKRVERMGEARAVELGQQHQRKDEFLAMLGHELRNPLAALRHGVDLLALVPADSARREEIRQMMDRQSSHMGHLLEQLLDVARLTAAKFQITKAPVDLTAIAQVAVEAATPLVDTRRQQLSVTLPRLGELTIAGDAMRLTQVMENLLSNAAKYTDKGGHVEFVVSSSETHAQIRVRDTGIGMDPELLPRIFELFTQGPRNLEREGGGLGLGLPLVKRVVEMHGGTVNATSGGLGQGSEFIVILPRTLPTEVRVGEPPKAAAEVAPSRILVVDDVEDNANVLVEILTIKGHQARAAYDGPAALDVARSFHPDVVLLDIGLPVMDGYEVAERLRAENPGQKPRLVALSGYQEDAERLRRAHFDRHLLKPADMQTFFTWLAEWQRADQ